MKKFLTIIFASLSTLAYAQEMVDLSRTIDDNGHKLSIRVTGTTKGRFIDYYETFKVEGLSKPERVAITDHILDSLGVPRVEQPLAPLPMMLAEVPAMDHSMSMTVNKQEGHYTPVATVETGNVKPYSGGNSSPFIKEVWLDDNGFLRLRYSFMKGREEFIYEKSTDAGDKSESERQQFITDFEEEIELPVM